jgi:hypothetical protein
MYTNTKISRSARPICFFATRYSHVLYRQGGEGGVCELSFWRKGVRTDQRRAAGVGAGGGQPGSSAMARRSLALVETCEIRVFLGVRLGATQDGGGSQPEERHSLAAEVHRIDRRRKNPVRRVFVRIRHLWRNVDSISEFAQPLPQSVPCYQQAA